MPRLCVIDLPGLDSRLLHSVPPSSALGQWISRQKIVALTPTFPAVTCSIQASLTTGTPPSKHGIIANGLPTFRSVEDQALVDASNFARFRRQISFWEQSNQFLQSRRFWRDTDGRSRYKTALLFFQNSMPGFAGVPRPAADIVLTPKPDHGPDGKLVSLCWSNPPDLVPRLFKELGPFPLMNYWGPLAGIASSQWIAKSAAIVWRELQPQLQLTYIPHLDYDLQRFGPDSPQAHKAVADLAAALEPLIDAVTSTGGELVLLSEYSMRPVTRSIAPNRILAEAQLLITRPTADGPLIDFEQSQALAMVDHQIAHVYAKTPRAAAQAQEILSAVSLVVSEEKHRRSGDVVLAAPPDAWFDYRWWSDPAKAPSFAATVDIHRKPGYDPLELFWNPATKGTSQDATQLRGSHGLVNGDDALLIGRFDLNQNSVDATAVAPLLSARLADNS